MTGHIYNSTTSGTSGVLREDIERNRVVLERRDQKEGGSKDQEKDAQNEKAAGYNDVYMAMGF